MAHDNEELRTIPHGKLRFNVLGPLEVWVGTERLRFGGLIQERILVALLLETDTTLPVTRLVEAAWVEAPPATASHQVRKAVADLRRRLPGGGEILVTDGPGYRAAVSPDQLDLSMFHGLLAKARDVAAIGNTAEVARALGEAVALWRGPVLGGSASPVIEATSAALEERQAGAIEQLFDIRLARGEAAELVSDLREIVAKYPLREAMRGQLMLALHRSERQAEALAEYSKVRELLVEELGIDPGPSLTKLYEDILRESPELAAPWSSRSAPTETPAAVDSPCTLPYDISDFSGRECQLNEILDRARQSGDAGTHIIAIDGMGGSGKTSLAVRAAHRLADSFPDGQLYIDLRGYSPGQQPMSPVSALGTLLRVLGLPDDRIPEDLAGRTAQWRTALAGKRLLILLDNTSDATDVRPLLPTEPGCLVVLTTRARLIDLDGAHWLSLGVMTPEESLTLIRETLGERRVAAESAAAAELARLCDYLPLALRIATARLGKRFRWTVQYMVDRLRDETRRLDELSTGERSVAATLRLSYQALGKENRVAFRTLALHPGGGVDVYAAGALLGTSPRHGEEVLELLLDVHLVEQPEIGRYAFHDLVSSFARGLHSSDPASTDEAAVERLLSHYLTVTEAACRILFPGRRNIPTGISDSSFEHPPIKTAQQAQAWFAREQNTLLSAITLAVRHRYDRHAVCLARNVIFHLNACGLLDEFEMLAGTAVTAARRLGDDALLGVSLANLGVAYWELGKFAEGIEVAQGGRSLAERLGDRGTEAHSDSTLGLYNSLLGRFPEALAHLERAIAQERQMGLSRAESESLTILSTLYEQWGRYEDAADAAKRAVELSQQLGQHENKLVALVDLGFAYAGLGRYTDADAALAQARELCDDTRQAGIVAMALALSAEIAYHLGEQEQSADYVRASLDRITSSVSPLRSVKVKNMIGRVLHKHGNHRRALDLHKQARELASRLRYRIEEAYAHLGMARATQALGDATTAARHRAACEELFASMDVPPGRRRN
ncbi:BTAD domain-containing putative transcriptional regulator [Streptomyces caniscabiei]|uniref:Tetratricopeptide repeat protein n=1 Tax=Streptomyces caniscabiei TaxID=2746961 RepID=A0A927QLG2_9ACTN|nr:BTAD domain-containing putative transcriptional regulator [Streptomyces caniscabiei]MBD9725907.1 tetratricopeptide repeat protein [Streptomyces caniscabiei]MDX3507625.1 BTAD domain-containing putative transcriptional regulator [Streptomyces caniscabiei]MDX3717587.1 BTAD domain-containing putative transcriptional regulator [Streptomyces caniscabiei]WEO25339.1 BTAD domain-containing putative transcriptional regulator [Streptomyces caniscabiei]